MASFNDDAYEGIDREDQRWSVAIGGKYLFTREVGVALNFYHDSQTSAGADRFINFDMNRIMLSLVLQR